MGVCPAFAFSVELHSGVGLRALTTFVIGFMPLLVFIASFHNPAAIWKIRRLDYACGAMSLAGTAAWLVTRNGVVAIIAAIVADFMAGLPTMMKSWSNPESETVASYIGAVLNSGILLLTIQHWTVDEAAFPLFIFSMASVQVVFVGGKLGHVPAACAGSACREPPGLKPKRTNEISGGRRPGRAGRNPSWSVTTKRSRTCPPPTSTGSISST